MQQTTIELAIGILEAQQALIQKAIAELKAQFPVQPQMPTAIDRADVSASTAQPARRRTMSAAARRRISLAQKKRWAQKRS